MSSKIKYYTYSQLMNSVEQDLEKYLNENLIDRQRYIKTVRRVNADLGLKVNIEKEVIIPIKNNRGVLPNNFLYAQLIMVCSKTKLVNLIDSAENLKTMLEIDPIDVIDCKMVCPPGSLATASGCYYVATTVKNNTKVEYKLDKSIRLTERSLNFCTNECNTHPNGAEYELDLTDGEVIVNFAEGEIYLNYLSDMTDENNNILIVDHPLLTDYYEYSVKKKIFEDIFMNSDDPSVKEKIQLTAQLLSKARKESISFVNTVEYGEIIELYAVNRKKFYQRFIAPVMR